MHTVFCRSGKNTVKIRYFATVLRHRKQATKKRNNAQNKYTETQK